IFGPSRLIGTDVRALDLRCGASLVLAGLVANGTTRISDIQHIKRGYENIVEKFGKLQADLWYA
ncbi:MAG TPA: UDP-N-acetylglucosamine 1-carboxyvinyltransferase, partial [Thermomicrobiaceae bacterium]|nr:UDP-N-acetylglucosamine 1-carboxyvinyltransferase [Thermomicrobiaceae bacterium]